MTRDDLRALASHNPFDVHRPLLANEDLDDTFNEHQVHASLTVNI